MQTGTFTRTTQARNKMRTHGANREHMSNPETRLHCAVVDYLRQTCPDCIAFHVPNGGKRSKETARLMKRLGTLAGVFDLIVLAPGANAYFLECKSESGTLEPEQKWFKAELIKMGFAYAVIRNFDDLRAFIIQNKIPNRLAEIYEPALRRREFAA